MADDEAREIELEQVFRWKCLDCGHANFHAGTPMSGAEVDLPDIPKDLLEGGEWFAVPNFVFCWKCEAKFSVKEPEMPDFPEFPFPDRPLPIN
jgi:hypothetical protein